jgi:hypothetical protein
MSPLVKDVMTSQVVWVEWDTPFAAIAAALREFRVSAFPVLNDDGAVIGVVSGSDLLAKVALGGGEEEMPGTSATASTTRQSARTPSTSRPGSRSTDTKPRRRWRCPSRPARSLRPGGCLCRVSSHRTRPE